MPLACQLAAEMSSSVQRCFGHGDGQAVANASWLGVDFGVLLAVRPRRVNVVKCQTRGFAPMCSSPSLSSDGAEVEGGCHLLVICFIRKLKARMDHSKVLSGPWGLGDGRKKLMPKERSDEQSLIATSSSQRGVGAAVEASVRMLQQADGNGGRKGEAKGEGPLVQWFWSPNKTGTGIAGLWVSMTGVCSYLEGRIWQLGENEWTHGRALSK